MESVVPCVIDYAPRRQFVPFHARRQRFACIVTHRRAGKTVARIHDLHRDAARSQKVRPLRLRRPPSGRKLSPGRASRLGRGPALGDAMHVGRIRRRQS
jgi:hypothetical protein